MPHIYQISDEELDEFIAIYEDEYGEKLDREDAREVARRLLTLVHLLARKLPHEHTVTPRGDASSASKRRRA